MERQVNLFTASGGRVEKDLQSLTNGDSAAVLFGRPTPWLIFQGHKLIYPAWRCLWRVYYVWAYH